MPVSRAYDKYEYCQWEKVEGEDNAVWDIADITEEIIIDLKGWVPQKLKSE